MVQTCYYFCFKVRYNPNNNIIYSKDKRYMHAHLHIILEICKRENQRRCDFDTLLVKKEKQKDS